MAFRYLDDASLDAVRRAAIDLGFASDDNMQALVQDLPRPFVAATMPGGGNAAARLFGFVGELNTIRVLVTGEVPLHVWLKAAVFLAAGRPEELVFRRAPWSSAPPTVSPSPRLPDPRRSPRHPMSTRCRVQVADWRSRSATRTTPWKWPSCTPAPQPRGPSPS